MNKDLLLLLAPSLLTATLLAAFSVYVFLSAPGRYLLKWGLIPLSLVVWVMAIPFAGAVVGKALPASLPERFVLLGHNVVITGHTKTGIEVWARVGNATRLYVIPYSKQAEQTFAGGEKSAANGGRSEITRRGGTGETKDDYVSNLMLPEADNPKDAKPNKPSEWL